jgi:hypothetical protein
MWRKLMMAVLGLNVVAIPVLVGCDRTISKDETTSTSSDGTVKEKSDTVKQQPDGTIVHEQTEQQQQK